MADKWLVERLTKSKQSSPVWVELAEALEEFWDKNFFERLQTFEDSKNIFTANESHLNRKIAEFGDYFDTSLPIDTSGKRLSISWQRDNVHEKDTIVPFLNALRVNFAGLGVSWEPLFSAIDKPYAPDNLFTKEEVRLKGDSLHDYWMTSRGKIAVDLTHLHRLGMKKETFIATAKREIKRLRPSHIVYDGQHFILTINFEFKPVSYHINRQTISERGGCLSFSLTPLFDVRPSDVPWLDCSPLGVTHTRGKTQFYTDYSLGGASWSLDLFVNLGDRCVSIAGSDGDVIDAIKAFKAKESSSFLAHHRLPVAMTSVGGKFSDFTFSLRYHFDDYASDVLPTDTNSPIHGMSRRYSGAANLAYQLGADWSLDLVVDTGESLIPIRGEESLSLPPISSLSNGIKRVCWPYDVTSLTTSAISSRHPEMMYSMRYHFDVVPSDSMATDINAPIHGASSVQSGNASMYYQLGADWSLDLTLLDSHISGTDGDKLPPFMQSAGRERAFFLPLRQCDSGSKKSSLSYSSLQLTPRFSSIKTSKALNIGLEVSPNINEKPWLAFDDVPADFAPLDTPLWN